MTDDERAQWEADQTRIIWSYACGPYDTLAVPALWPLGDAIAAAALCVEREQYEAQVADLAAKVALLEQERDALRDTRAHVAEGIAQAKRGELKIISDPTWAEEAADALEIEALRQLAWEGWERLDAAHLDYAILADDLREQIAECERLRRTLADFYQARDAQVAALERERDALQRELETAWRCVVMP